MQAAYNKFEQFVNDLIHARHDLRATGDTVKQYLSNTVPSASGDLIKADLAEITAENGYTAGGDDTQNDTTKSGGTSNMTAVDITVTASGGTIGPFQYLPHYNDTQASPVDPLICWFDRGSSLTLNDGESHTTDYGSSFFSIT
ncbi:MAG: hypothetical protein GWM98_15420 [Nitrospinaceae bacterium]|nr:hypothetical protein [Nitrospinaceae bacterium]NIR55614.1 hypothetical protein [Nitrospinaceae bacterium]NIS86048.1 hypothetical protein [Nitrospinaceae bacterium]NIT82891.1 hypothetical protein [Nitrospinaceae bacterium]NIU45096.1 hypothetical protein [Nitrospinaceae bacterium]